MTNLFAGLGSLWPLIGQTSFKVFVIVVRLEKETDVHYVAADGEVVVPSVCHIDW